MIRPEVKESVPASPHTASRKPSGEAAPLAGSRDDRGRPIERLSVRELKRTAERKSDPRAVLARRIRDAVRAEARRQTPGRFFAGLGIIIGLNVVTSVMLMAFPGIFWIRPIVFWGLIAAFVFYMRWYISVVAAKNISVSAVAEGVCGSCTYTLKDIVAEPDGCVVCPECGAAWRAERIVRPHWDLDQSPFTDYQPPWIQRFFLAIPRTRDQLAPDDRGRYVRILDARLRLVAPAQRLALGSARIKELKRLTFRIGLVLRCLMSVIPFGISAMLVVGGVYGVVTASRRDDVYWISGLTGGFGLIMFLVGLATIFSLSFRGPKRVTATFREHSICGCCGQDLAGFPADGMGMTSCPVCRSGWRLSGRFGVAVAEAAGPLSSTAFSKADPIEEPPERP